MTFVRTHRRWLRRYVIKMQLAMNMSHWDIHLKEDWPPPNDEDPKNIQATVWRSNTYNDADLYLNADHIENREDLRYAITHELVHLMLRDYDRAIEAVEDHVNKPAFDIVNKWNYQEMERAVDFIARAWCRTLPMPPEGKGLD